MPHAMDPAVLGRVELIEISGSDAMAFAHAQLSSDVASLAAGAWQWSAWLNAQGRTRAVFALLRVASDRLLLWLPLGDARETSEGLSRFVLRAKAKVAAIDGFAVYALDARELLPSPFAVALHANGHAITLPGAQPRVAWLGPASSDRIDANVLAAWRLVDIDARLPWIDIATRDEFVPQALELDKLGAVRFDKGCYPGQEIAARLHFPRRKQAASASRRAVRRSRCDARAGDHRHDRNRGHGALCRPLCACAQRSARGGRRKRARRIVADDNRRSHCDRLIRLHLCVRMSICIIFRFVSEITKLNARSSKG